MPNVKILAISSCTGSRSRCRSRPIHRSRSRCSPSRVCKFATEYQWAQTLDYVTEQPEAASQTLLFENVEKDGLGLPLPAGSFTFYAMRNGQPFLLGQGEMADKAIKEKVEVKLQETPGVRVLQLRITEKDGLVDLELVVTNDLPYPVRFTSWLGSQHSYTVMSSTPNARTRPGRLALANHAACQCPEGDQDSLPQNRICSRRINCPPHRPPAADAARPARQT